MGDTFTWPLYPLFDPFIAPLFPLTDKATFSILAPRKSDFLSNKLKALTLYEGGKMTEGYCVKCKKKVEMQNPVESKTKKGTKIAKGKCPDCGTTVCRMGGLK